MRVVIPMSDIIARFLDKKKEQTTRWLFLGFIKGFEFVCKPSSVVYGHLSRLIVTDKLKRYSRHSVGRTTLLTEAQSCSKWGLHGTPCYHGIGELLPRLSILTVKYGGLFLLHCPEGHPCLTLSGTLSYAARTFLMAFLPRDRITGSNRNYYSIFL